MKTAVLLKSFKRPDLIKKILQRLVEANVENLYITSDGPRNNIIEEEMLVNETREVINTFDFGNCNVIKKFLPENLGIHRLHELTSWFFEYNDRGIMLEDDILPDVTYFKFIDELLEYYEDNNKIKIITGSNFIDLSVKSKCSYFFTQIPSFWGWATWKQFWNSVDFNLINKISEKEFHDVIKSRKFKKKDESYFERLLNFQRNGHRIGGDQIVMFNIWYQNGLSIVPSKNLISNIGINHKSAYSQNADKISNLANLRTTPIDGIYHPTTITVNKKYDELLMKKIFNKNPSIYFRLKNKIFNKL